MSGGSCNWFGPGSSWDGGDLTNDEWPRLKPYLPKTGQRGGRWKSQRRVIDGIRFRERTGVPWRDLPARGVGYGNSSDCPRWLCHLPWMSAVPGLR
ncbi:transposase [Streptomyces sp. 8N114]|uniref:transposase n=1 Tax=Streptomyces sp. 8N114 TaxID=3457419 RepID=UPI003FD546D1